MAATSGIGHWSFGCNLSGSPAYYITLSTPDHLLGRAQAALGTISQAAYLLALPAVGFVTQRFGTRATFALVGIPAVIVVLLLFGRAALRGTDSTTQNSPQDG